MFTLSEASKDTKKFLKFGGLLIAFLIFGFILVKIIFIVKEIIAPTPPPKATTLYGQLPQQVFPANITNISFSYTVNTISGGFSMFPTVLNIYKIKRTPPSLLAVNKIDAMVNSIGFNLGYKAISDNIFEWISNSSPKILTRTLKANIISGDFKITSSYMTEPNILTGKNLPDQLKAQSVASEMFSVMNLPTTDLDLNNPKIQLYSIINNTLVPSTSLSLSQIIEIDFMQNAIDKLPIFYESPNKSNIYVLIGGGEGQPQIVEANYLHQIPSSEVSTYPIKPANVAFEDLKKGKGYIASYDGTSNNVYINNVILAYYISSQLQDFIMPIYIFTGNDNFYAYVPAVTDEWINK